MYLLRLYPLCLIALTLTSLLLRFSLLGSYPFGFSGHAVGHANLRRRIYDALFSGSLDSRSWNTVRDIVIQEQHGPQSLIEALLTPIFGFGFTESRLIVSVLGAISLLLILAWGSVAINRWFGLLALMTVGMAPYALYFSRYGDAEHVNIYLHGFLLFFAAQRCVALSRLRDYALFGIAAGLSLYVYATNQFLCALVVGLTALFKIQKLRTSPLAGTFARLVIGLTAAIAVAYPMIRHHLTIGRSLLLRTPYGSSNYEFSQGFEIPGRMMTLMRELFSKGGDAWFARPHGALSDYTLILAAIGLITIAVLLLKKSILESFNNNQRLSLYFTCALTLTLIIFGGLPAILSPEPTFRRAILLAIGLDISKAFGIYGIASYLLKKAPRRPTQATIALLALGFIIYSRHIFLNDCSTTESNSSNWVVETIRFIKSHIRNNETVQVLLPTGAGFPIKEEFIYFLTFDLGYPSALPTSILILELSDLSNAKHSGVIVPFFTYSRLSREPDLLPSNVKISRQQIFSNQLGETFAVVDFEALAPAISSE
jgi:hypothetical protein